MYTKARGDNTLCVRAMCFMFHQQLWSYEKVPQFKISADRLVKLGINPTATCFHGEGLIHHIIAAPLLSDNSLKCMLMSILSSLSNRRPKLVFKTDYRLMQVKSIAECSTCIKLPFVIKIFVLPIF